MAKKTTLRQAVKKAKAGDKATRKEIGKVIAAAYFEENSILKKVPSANEMAKKHKVSQKTIIKAIKVGSKVEKEHTNKKSVAKKIAMAHVDERPDYYEKLKKIE